MSVANAFSVPTLRQRLGVSLPVETEMRGFIVEKNVESFLGYR